MEPMQFLRQECEVQEQIEIEQQQEPGDHDIEPDDGQWHIEEWQGHRTHLEQLHIGGGSNDDCHIRSEEQERDVEVLRQPCGLISSAAQPLRTFRELRLRHSFPWIEQWDVPGGMTVHVPL